MGNAFSYIFLHSAGNIALEQFLYISVFKREKLIYKIGPAVIFVVYLEHALLHSARRVKYNIVYTL